MNSNAMLATLPEKPEIEVCRMNNPLAPWELTIDFNLDILPKALRDEIESLNKTTAYYLAQLHGNAEAKRKWVEKVVVWMTESTAYGPEHFRTDPKWERIYPAIVLSDEPLVGENPLMVARERDIFEQRVIITSLLKDTITKEKRRKLEERAASLVCARNPKDEKYFTEETLQECLDAERLTDKRAVNKELDRAPSTYVKDGDYREALWSRWQNRDEKNLSAYLFERGEWGARQDEVKETFTLGAMAKAAAEVRGREWNPSAMVARELQVTLYQWMEQADQRGEMTDYLLDPREDDDWIGIRDFIRALKDQNLDSWHYECQEGKLTAQKWMKEEGLAEFYGTSADWWAQLPDLTEEEAEEILRAGNDRMKNDYRDSRHYDLVRGKYETKLNEVLTHA
jgi:hypothetical protein